MTGPEVEWVTGQQPLPAPAWCASCGHTRHWHQAGQGCAGRSGTDLLDDDWCDCYGYDDGDDYELDDDDGPPVPQPVTAQPQERYL